MPVNPFAEEQVETKAVLVRRFWNEGAFDISIDSSQVIRDFLDYVENDFTNGIGLVVDHSGQGQRRRRSITARVSSRQRHTDFP
jgi:hypothetical protein